MGIVHQLKIRKKIYDYEQCSGCHRKYSATKNYMEIILPYENYDKHILLCETCDKKAVAAGIF